MTANTVFIGFLYLMGAGFLVALIFYPTWAILHRILSWRLDSVLFRKPFFDQGELEKYRYFPLSLVKSINYVFLIAYPGWARKRRFKELDQQVEVSRGIRVLCKFHFTLGLLGALLFVIAALYLGVGLIILP